VKNVCGPDGEGVSGGVSGTHVTYGFRGTPRTWRTPQKATRDNAPVNPHHRLGSALAHDTAGTSGPGNPRRSVGRSPQTPRDERSGDRPGRPGTLPPVPGRLTHVRRQAALGALGLLGAVAFAVLTWQVAAGGALVRRDGRVLHWFLRSAAAHPGFGTTAHYLCKLGNIQVAVPVLLAAVVYTAWAGRQAGAPLWWLPPSAAALAMALLPVVVTVVKDAVHRPPPGLTVPDPSGYGYFPSGHTATSAVAFGAAALILLPEARGRAARLLLVAGTPVLLLAIGCALVWCDYHWPLDVLASWCLTVTLLSGVAAAQAVARAAAARDAAPEVSCSSGSPG
jgi:membrane-associated phospholipid phosphatase